MWDFMKDESYEDRLLCGPETGFRRIFTPYTDDPHFSRGKNELKRVRENFPKETEESETKIDLLYKEGLPAPEFWKLFVQCAQCGFVMAKQRYPYSHRCPKRLKTSKDGETDANTTDADIDDSEEGEDAAAPNSYDYYLQFASAPSTPKNYASPNPDPDSEWEVDAEGEPTEEDDDELPDPLTVLEMIRAFQAGNGSSH
ncbi:hypothetical protein H1R20_g11194, partial [Candolleomyces eurysporus]